MKKLIITFLIFVTYNTLYGYDSDVMCINTLTWSILWQKSTWTWSNSSAISFKDPSVLTWSWWTSLQEDFKWYYVNRDNDSTIIGNYLRWYYYDTTYWFFKLDWSNNPNRNVRFVASVNLCGEWYGYKLSWYAKWVQTEHNNWWSYIWFINFEYNTDIFVYYCESDKKLHWYAYSRDLWFQNFEWIWFEIRSELLLTEDLPSIINNNNKNSLYVNDFSSINIEEDLNVPYLSWQYVQWDLFDLQKWKESIFYIIK